MAMDGSVATRLIPKTAATIARTLRPAISRRRASSPSQSSLSLATTYPQSAADVAAILGGACLRNG